MDVLRLLANDILDAETQMHYNFISQIENTAGKHRHDFFEIFLVVNGNALHHVNGIVQLLLEGTIVLIRPDDIHYYEKYGEGNCQFINLAFSQDTLKDFFNYLGDNSLPESLLSCEFPPLKLLTFIEKEAARTKLEVLAVLPRENKTHIRSFLRLLLADFIFNYFAEETKIKKGMPQWLVHLMNEIKKKENFAIGLPAILRLSNKSQEYISRVFKEYFEKTPTDYINELRLNYTANMLEFSDTDISDICFEAGFNSISHFYHLFKKQYKVSPLKYRKAKQNLLKF